jgi:hypothetical protein
MKFALDILWEKYGEEPFWLDDATPIVAEYLGVTNKEANSAILSSMVGGSIIVIGSSNTIEHCLCNGDIPHTHYDGNLQFKFYLPIWDKSTPRKAP